MMMALSKSSKYFAKTETFYIILSIGSTDKIKKSWGTSMKTKKCDIILDYNSAVSECESVNR